MKLIVVFFSTLFAVLAAAQSIGELPKCAQGCVGNSLGGCNGLNITCICANKDFITDISCCIANKCDAADQNSTIQFANSICAVVQITLPQAAGCSGTGSAAPTAATKNSTAATASGAATSTSSGSSSVVSLAPSTSGGATTAASSGGAGPASTSAHSTSSTGAARPMGLVDTAMGAAGLAVAAFAWL